jgi:hypothetical protein
MENNDCQEIIKAVKRTATGGKRLLKKKKRKSLLCFDAMLETIKFWRLSVFCKLSMLLGSWRLVNIGKRYRTTYRRAVQPHEGRITRFLARGIRIKMGRSWSDNSLLEVSEEPPPVPSPAIITGFGHVALYHDIQMSKV